MTIRIPTKNREGILFEQYAQTLDLLRKQPNKQIDT